MKSLKLITYLCSLSSWSFFLYCPNNYVFPTPSTGKGSSSISSDISSGTDHTPTKAPKNVTTTEGKASGAHYQSPLLFFFPSSFPPSPTPLHSLYCCLFLERNLHVPWITLNWKQTHGFHQNPETKGIPWALFERREKNTLMASHCGRMLI